MNKEQPLTEDQAIRLLPWWLNDTLETAEKAEVERWLADSERVRDELQSCREAWEVHTAEPPVEDLVAYVEGRLEEPDLTYVEAHLSRSEQSRREVALLRQSLALVEAKDGTIVRMERVQPRERASITTWRPMLIAAALAVAVTSAVWWASFRGVSTPVSGVVADARVNVPIVEVLPSGGVVRGDDSSLPTVMLSDRASRLVLILVSEVDPGPVPLAIEATGTDGTVFWSGEGLVRDPRGEYTVSLTVPKDIEILNLSVFALDGNERREIDSYRLRIERRAEASP